MSEFGNHIRRLRKDLNLTQVRLAKISGVSRSEICKIENGHKNNPSISNLNALAYHLGVSPEELSNKCLPDKILIDISSLEKHSDPEVMPFSEYLKLLREKKNLSIKELSRISNVDILEISRVEENNDIDPSIPLLINISPHLNVSLGELLNKAYGITNSEKFMEQFSKNNDMIVRNIESSPNIRFLDISYKACSELSQGALEQGIILIKSLLIDNLNMFKG